jgi:hypothetical protein
MHRRPRRQDYTYSQFLISPCEIKIFKDDNYYYLKNLEALFWTYIDGDRDLLSISQQLDISPKQMIYIIQRLVKLGLVEL